MTPEHQRAFQEPSPETTALNDASHWRAETEKGAEAFSESNFDAASAPFSEALHFARRLFIRAAAEQFSARKAARMLVVSQHNIAENFMRRGMLEEAHTHYLSAFSTLCDWLEAPNASDAMRRACAENLAEAMTAIVAYLRRTQAEPQQITAIYTRAARNGDLAPHRSI